MHRITRSRFLDHNARRHYDDGFLKMPNREGSAFPLLEPGISRSGWVPSPQQGPHCAKSDGGHLRDARSGTLCSPRPESWCECRSVSMVPAIRLAGAERGEGPATMARRPSEEHDGSVAYPAAHLSAGASRSVTGPAGSPRFGTAGCSPPLAQVGRCRGHRLDLPGSIAGADRWIVGLRSVGTAGLSALWFDGHYLPAAWLHCCRSPWAHRRSARLHGHMACSMVKGALCSMAGREVATISPPDQGPGISKPS
jgi:hypothetical protein